MIIRPENKHDVENIRNLVTLSFVGVAHSDGGEAAIIDRLRAHGALTVSLVAEQDDEIVGYAAFSPVTIEGIGSDWYGLGPVAVKPDLRKCGIGSKLIKDGLGKLKSLPASGCVVLGDPEYYSRFGFKCDPSLTFPDAPAEYFQCLDFCDEPRRGAVVYDSAFYGI